MTLVALLIAGVASSASVVSQASSATIKAGAVQGTWAVSGDTMRASLDMPGAGRRPVDFAVREGAIVLVAQKVKREIRLDAPARVICSTTDQGSRHAS